MANGTSGVDFGAIVTQVNNIIGDLLPVIATVGGAVLGIVAVSALWNRFGPAIVSKVFNKAK